MTKRLFDILFAFFALLILLPFFVAIAVKIKFNSAGPIFYLQKRVGKNNKDFSIYKFRTMKQNADKAGLLTVGMNDSRITTVGVVLRKYKLDELPQLLNVLIGDMSIVGPRPEVRKYVDMYNAEQLEVLSVKPGITDYASILYSQENELLANAADPEKEYIENIMPHKLQLNGEYIRTHNFLVDLKIIWKTVAKIF
ncbi:MAG TPA: sugar transferase [Bacteroidia bacterium]|nr:sugar transferase [Bacteroidia bacterium]